MRKRLTALLLALCALPVLGAQAREHVNIQQLRKQAAQGWTQQYQSHGRTISIDVMPLVPKVEAVPLMEVRRAEADITLPGGDTLWTISRNDYFGFLLDHYAPTGEEPAGSVMVNGRRMAARPYQTLYQRAYDDDSLLIPGNPLRFDEIMALMAQGLQVAGLKEDVVDLGRPEQVMSFGYYDTSPEQFHSPGWATFTWQVHFKGIPCLSPYAVYFKQGSDEPDLLSPSMTMCIRRPDLFWLGGTVPVQTQLLEEDLPLLPFEKVVAGYEKEIAAGRVRYVFDLTLEYALQPKVGQTMEQWRSAEALFYTKPFWRLECLWRPNAGESTTLPEIEGNGPFPDPRNNISRVSLLMDAQTGEIIDPTSSAHDRAEYKGILTWQEAGGK